MMIWQKQTRRVFLRHTSSLLALCLPSYSRLVDGAEESDLYPAVRDDYRLKFPRDHGAHPQYRTEWWYLTAWLESADGPLGLQITFFRSRTPFGRDNPSRFAPEQLVLAHAALAIPARGKLLHDQQAWREGETVAQFDSEDTDLAVGLPYRRWSLVRQLSDDYRVKVKAEEFSFSITATPPRSMAKPVLQGTQGFSQKGPDPLQSSYYYSRPQLRISGEYQIDTKKVAVSGTGWLDHEWSSELLDEQAVGWDWIGLNFEDGSALMAFQMRTESGDVLHTSAKQITVESDEVQERSLSPRFTALRYWQSPRTGGRYPVSVRVQAGTLDLTIEPLFDDQELDSRGSTGIIYWEGAVQVWHTSDITQSGNNKTGPIATGYLELTGYAGELTI